MARYEYGVEKRIYVYNLDEQSVERVVNELVAQAKEVNSDIAART